MRTDQTPEFLFGRQIHEFRGFGIGQELIDSFSQVLRMGRIKNPCHRRV
jgi:hypothetical protein